MAAPALAVVVVTWNCRDLALRCLETAARSVVPGGMEFIVVDNASSDDTVTAIASHFPFVRLIRNERNAGFAAACNQGLRASVAPFALLLNPDAFPTTPHSLGALLRVLAERADLGAIGPRLLSEDGSHQVGDAGFRPSLGAVLAWSLGLHRFVRGFVLGGAARAGLREVDWLCGASMLVRREAFAQSGGLDERLFMYAEDVEWGCRLRDQGWRLGYLGEVTVLHLQGGTQGRGVRTNWLDSLGRVVLAQSGPRAWLWFWSLLWLGFSLRALAYAGRASEKAAAMTALARYCGRQSRSSEAAGPSMAASA